MATTLKAMNRENLAKSVTKQLRTEGNVPGVLYGKGKESKSIAVNGIELVKLIRDEGRNTIISLDTGGKEKHSVMLHDYQMDAIRGELTHVDFYVVDLTEEMNVEVALRLEGEPAGAKEGGILQQPVYELEVRAKPNHIPDEITINVSDLNIGDVLAVADIPASDKYEILSDPEFTIATVLPPESDKEPEEVDFDAEPEVIGENKDDE
ncbi:50S ribosomal protein L25/general stress protein Ctc [Virgibacillus soli]